MSGATAGATPEPTVVDEPNEGADSWTRRQWLTLLATGLGLFMVFLDGMIVNVALPDIQRSFGVGEAGLQWVVTAYTLGMAAFMMSNATVADRFGRRRTFVIGIAVFAVGSAGAGLAPNETALIAARAVQGIAAATVSVTSLALVSAAFPIDHEKAKAVGVWSAVASVGAALAPTLGGVLAETFGWRAVFFVNLPFALLAVALTYAFVEESRDPTDRGLDLPGQALFVLGIGALALAIIQGQSWGWTSPTFLAVFAVGAVAAAGFVAVELRTPQPMTDVRLFADRNCAAAIATTFGAFATIYGMILIVTQYFQNIEGYDALEAGLLMFPFALALTVMSPIAGRIASRVGPRRPILVGQSILVVSVLAAAGAMWIGAAAVSASLAVLAVAGMLLIVPITSVALNSVSPERAGMASGIMSSQRALGGTVGYAVLGAILAAWLGATLNGSLEATIPDAAERSAVTIEIIDQATPAAAVAEVGAGSPLTTDAVAEQDAIVDAAREDFVHGVQLALLVAAAFGAALWPVAYRGLARSSPAGEAEEPSAGEVRAATTS